MIKLDIVALIEIAVTIFILADIFFSAINGAKGEKGQEGKGKKPDKQMRLKKSEKQAKQHPNLAGIAADTSVDMPDESRFTKESLTNEELQSESTVKKPKKNRQKLFGKKEAKQKPVKKIKSRKAKEEIQNEEIQYHTQLRKRRITDDAKEVKKEDVTLLFEFPEEDASHVNPILDDLAQKHSFDQVLNNDDQSFLSDSFLQHLEDESKNSKVEESMQSGDSVFSFLDESETARLHRS